VDLGDTSFSTSSEYDNSTKTFGGHNFVSKTQNEKKIISTGKLSISRG
jgi:hypothetical protein